MTPRDCPLVVFDLDGTLVDSLEATIRCFQEAVEPFLDRAPSRQDVLDRFGPADHEIVTAWAGPAHGAEAVTRLYQCYAEAWPRVQTFPGVPSLLADLRAAGRRLALFTGRGRPSTDALLEATGLAGVFETTVTGEEIPRPKPAPDGLLAVLYRTGVAGDRAVYVGDARQDVAVARGAGVVPIAALWGSPEREALRALTGVVNVATVDALRELLLGPAP